MQMHNSLSFKDIAYINRSAGANLTRFVVMNTQDIKNPELQSNAVPAG